ncbi:chloramphenicol-sensitive protein RarD [Motilibacter peucedani]|uniref:Chloramphenicol-sensitive protein RarD n=1 Tax=Motilibacter peucedani TaxID=598650 RepID=A0A420XLB4_9ACTN|nr:chloramphenicol-sensitive protein RarD [Motilibacter peucedani]
MLWGAFPLYFPLLEPAGALEILAHRVFWTAVTCLAVLLVMRRPLPWRGLSRRQAGVLAAAAVANGTNWGVYIAAVNTGHVVEAALGYFINPLVSVLLGVVVLHERLRRAQAAAVAVAGAGVLVLTAAYGSVPWIALVLGLSFGTYGLLKKQAAVEPLPGLAVESLVLAPLAVALLAGIELTGRGSLSAGAEHDVLLATTGLVTAAPLLLFGMAALRVPLSVMGLLQYVTPTLQLGIGVLVRHEPMTRTRWAGFGLVWASLAVFASDQVRAYRARRAGAPLPERGEGLLVADRDG